VIRPDDIITKISTGANGQIPIGSNKKPFPNLNRTPPIKKSSPIYIIKVVIAATSAGTSREIIGRLKYNKLPA